MNIENLHQFLGPGNYRRISRITGRDRRHVTRVLQGRYNASMETAEAIADAAGVDMDDLRRYIEHQRTRRIELVDRAEDQGVREVSA